MSKHFFHVGLSKAIELIKEGELDKASIVIYQHMAAFEGAEEQQALFAALIHSVREYWSTLDEAQKFLKAGDRERAIYQLQKAISNKGKQVISLAKEVVKVCKDEEIKAI